MGHILLFLLRLLTFAISFGIGVGIFFLYRIKINENDYNKTKQILYFVFTLLVMFTFNSWWLIIIYFLLILGEYMRKTNIEEMIAFEEEKLDDFTDEYLDRDISDKDIDDFINNIVEHRKIRKNKKLIIYIIDWKNKSRKKKKNVPEKVIIDFPLGLMGIFASKFLQKLSFIPKEHRKKLKIFKKIYKVLKRTKDPFSITVNANEENNKAYVKIFVA